MKTNEQEILLDLDEALKQMAEETPEMPEDFHDAWVRAIEESRTDNQPVAEPVPAEAPEKSGRRSFPWAQICSVAAALIVLIGGTAAVRDRKLSEERVVSFASVGLQESTADTFVAQSYNSAAQPGKRDSRVSESASMSADSAPACEEAACEEPVYDAEAAEDSSPAYGETAESAAPAYEKAAEDSAPVYEEAECGEAAPIPDETPAATGKPGALTEKVKEPTFFERISMVFSSGWNSFGDFLSDMGQFLVAALPFLVIFAAAAVVTRLVVKKHKARKKP